MAATKAYILSGPPGAYKAIPLSSLTADTWQAWGLTGEAGSLPALYDAVPWLRAAVDARANAVANLPFTFSPATSDDEGEESVVPAAIDAALSVEFDTLLNMLEAWLTLYGAAYVWKGRNAVRVRDLRPLHPGTITPKFDAKQGLVGFERAVNGLRQTLTPDELAYLWLPPRKAEIGPGVAPAQAALAAAGLLKSADEFGRMYFENGVIAPTLVTVPPGTPPEEKRRLESWAERTMTGLKKAFNVLGVAAEVKVTSLGEQIPLGSLALPELTDKKREDIATALGVPQTLLFSNAANYATAQQDDLHFYDKTIVPEARRIEQALNKQVFGPLGWRLRLKPERMEVYQQREAEKADKLAVLFDRDVLTREEAREAMGYPPEPERGKFKSDTRAENAIMIAAARPVVPPIQPVAQAQAQAPVQPQKAVDAVADALAKWERKALARVAEGKPDKAAAFESDAIPVTLKAWLAGALDGVTDGAGVKAAFAAAGEWRDYP